MAHTFLKPEALVNLGLGMLRRELLLPRLVQRVAFDQFRGVKDDTVNIKVPAVLSAREYAWRNDRTDAIVADNITELSLPITVNKHPYSAVQITDEQLTMDIRDFGEQVAAPQIRAVAEKLESYIATAMSGATYAAEVDFDAASDDFYSVLVAARKALNVANVPSAGRVVVLGANVEEAVLNQDTIRKATNSGDAIASSVLQDAVITRIAGFTIVGNVNSVDPDFAVAYHQSAFGFANAAPLVPAGAPFGATTSSDGFALRWVRDYDSDRMRDRSVFDAFAGAISVEDGRDGTGALTDENVRAVKINFTAAS